MMKQIAKRGLSLLLSLVMVLGMLPVMEQHAHAASGSFTLLNGILGASYSGKESADKGTKDGENSATFQAWASGLKRGSTNTITLTNNSGSKAVLSFNYTISGDCSACSLGKTNGSGSYTSTELENGGTVTITLTGKGSWTGGDEPQLVMTNIALTVVKENPNVAVVFDSSMGSVAVDGTTVTSGFSKDVATGSSVALTATASNSAFVGWVDGENKILSTSTSYSFAPVADTTVKAIFAKDGSTPIFMVGGASKGEYKDASGLGGMLAPTATYYTINGTHLFEGFDAAASFASASSGSKYMVLMNNATLSAGTYTIPSGVTLLIPFDSANTLYTGTPCSTGTYTTPTAYRTLTLGSGAELVVNGALSISGKHKRTETRGGNGSSPTGSQGFINTESGSKITVNNGGTLYAWGYIIGNGSVTANSGAKVYELFQITDFRGGTQSTGMSNSVFPLSQYYVQNIEIPLTIHAGATEYSFTTIYMSSSAFFSCVAFLGKDCMFDLTEGYVTKRYDGSADRLILDAHGKIAITPMDMDVGPESINSGDYVLGINGNFTVRAMSGTIELKQNMALLPGCELYIAPGATCQVGSGISVYIYDADSWDTYCWGEYLGEDGNLYEGDVTFSPVIYAPSRTYDRTVADLKDAQIIVEGGVNAVNGAVYTTGDGAQILGRNEGWAKIKPGTATVTYQLKQASAQYVPISVTSAKLMNADGTYQDTDKTQATYNYKDGKWAMTCDECKGNIDAATCKDAMVCVYCGKTLQERLTTHTWVDATCVNAKTCSVCGTTTGTALGHNIVTLPAVAATCTTSGWTEGKECSVCGYDEVAQVEIPALGHTAKDPVKENINAATCTQAGSYDSVVYCATCGGEISRETVVDPKKDHTYGNYIVDNAATCTEDGLKHRTCSGCNGDFEEVIPALGHTPEEGKEASCTQHVNCTVCGGIAINTLPHTLGDYVEENRTDDGYVDRVYYCTVCGNEAARATIAPGGGGSHTNIVHVDAIAATCTTVGQTAGAYCADWNTKCSTCLEKGEQYLKGMEEIPALGHSLEGSSLTYSWNEDYTVCTASGTCSHPGCEEPLTVTSTGITGEGTAPTCTEDGYTTYTATFAETYGVQLEPVQTRKAGEAAKDHAWSDAEYVWVDDLLSCTATSVCGNDANHVRTETVTVTPVVTAPTCEEKGYTTYTADFQQTWFVDQTRKEGETSALGHSWSAINPVWNEGKTSCTVDLVCKNNQTHIVSGVVSESVGQSVTSATCTETGLKTFTAVFAEAWRIGEQVTTEVIPAKGHMWTTVVYTWSEDYSTCTAERYCIVPTCGHVESETVTAVPDVDNVNVSCTTDGSWTYTATFTNKDFEVQVMDVHLDALGHDMTLVGYKAPTCQATGNREHYYCERCKGLFFDEAGENITNANAQTIGTVGHKYTTYTCDNNATCVEASTKTAYCDFNCGETDTVTDPEHPAVGHAYNGGDVVNAATCIETGEMLYTCTREGCTAETEDHSYTEVIDALGHEYESVVTEPTCTTEGYTTHTCTRCDENTANHVVVNSKVAALGHKDDNKDHICDNGCDVYQGVHIDNNKDHKCDHGCQEAIGVHDDANDDADHLCDYCEEQIGDHEYVDGECNCGYVKDLNVSLTIKAEGADDLVEAHIVKYGHEFSKTMTFSSTCIGMQSITVKVGGKVISDEGYTYNLFTNELTIEKEYVTDDITVVLTAIQRHAVGGTQSVYTAPTCTEEGKIVTTVHCADCGKPVSEFVTTLPADDHAYTSSYTAPTFQLDAYTTYTCGKCGDSYNEVHEGTKLTVVATIGHAKFESLEEALAIAEAGDVIVLQTSVAVEGDVEWNLDGITLRIANIDNDYGLVVRGNLTINGGTFKAAGLFGIGVTATGTLTINGGNFSVAGDNDYLIGSWGTTVINGGTFTGQYNCVNGFAGTVTINNGTFATDDYDYSGSYESEDVVGYVSVQGGTFSKDPAEYLAEGYCHIVSEDCYVVGKHEGGDIVIENEIPSTCTEAGSYDSVTYCTHCGVEYSRITESVVPTGHDYSEVPTLPTCTEQGYTTRSCTTCGYSYDADYVDALGHHMTAFPAVDPTCITPGNNVYYNCGECDGIFKDEMGEIATTVEAEMLPATGHSYSEGVVTAPTCTAYGYTTHTCTRCDADTDGYSYKDSSVNPLGHDYTSEVTQEATCTEDGERTYTCGRENCGHSYTEVIEAQGHKEKAVNGKLATCTEDGLTEGKDCEVCGEHLVEQEVIPAKGHTAEVITGKAASCTEDGLADGEKCSVCGVTTVEQEVIPAKGHTHSEAVIEKVVAPTCTENGSHEEVVNCTVCHVEISREKVTDEATGHSYDEGVVTAPTCTAQGYTTYTCKSKCGHKYQDNYVDALGHDEVIDEAVAPTCTETGLAEGSHCERCGATIKAQTVVGMLPHNLQQASYTAPTCTEDGCMVYQCSECDYENTVVSKATGHTETKIPAKDPDCTTTGLTAGVKCSVCGEDVVAQEVIPALGHAWESEVTAPTCTAQGYTFHKCSVCGDEKTDSYVAIIPHTEVIDEAKAPTCTETGLTEGKHCSVCDYVVIAQREVAALGHKEVSIAGKLPTCTEDGLTEGKDCSVCGEHLVAQDVIPAKGHTVVTVPAVDPVCGKPGKTEGTACSVCGDTLTEGEEIPALEHVWNEGRVTTLPTCTTEGAKTFTCTLCGGTKSEVIEKVAHVLEQHDGQHPTYYSIGWDAYETCKNCDHSTYKEIPALGEPSVSTYEEFIAGLKTLEEYANAYVKANPGKDPMWLLIKYVRTGVDRYNSGSWQIMAGYEDEAFAEYVKKQEEAYNKSVDMDSMINVTGLKNIKNFTLPNGDGVDFGHMFGTMDISYHNKGSVNHADVAGWAGDLVDLLSTADRHDVTGTLDEMIEIISTTYLNHSIAGESDQFSHTDMYGDLDGFYMIQELTGQEYEAGLLYEIMSNYFTEKLTDEQRADYFLKNRLNGVTGRNDIRDAVFNEYTGNSVIATLEGTREFKTQDLSDLRKACCYSFADYLCELAGDYVELEENRYYSVYSSEKSTLAPGITQEIYKGTTADGKNTVFYLAVADLSSPYVSIYANYKDNDPSKGWGMQRVLDQANAAQEKHSDPNSEYYIPNYTVVASINGAGYNMTTGEPGGLLIMGGVEYHEPNSNGFFGILKDGSAYIGTTEEYYELKAQGLIMEGIAGFGATLVKDGKLAVSYTDTYTNDRASRTAVGITKTGKVVFMVMDGRQEPTSCGGSMQEIAQVMLEAGCVIAINLDGGGSTTFVAKQEGADELSVVNNPSDGFQRSVSTSLIMVSTAPSSTAFDHAVLDSEVKHMTVGTSVQVTASGVSATGNPAQLPEGTVWEVSDPEIASVSESGVVTALANGQFDVLLVLDGQVVGSRAMNVVIPDAVYFLKENMNAVYGEPLELPVAALYEGKPVAILESDVSFVLSNAAGVMDGWNFIGDESTGIKSVKITAKLVENPEATSGSVNINIYGKDEASFDFENAIGGDRQLAWDREVSNATTVDNVTYNAIDVDENMVTTYTFGIDMTQIPMPEKLEDLVYMLPGADVEGNNSAWSFLLQLAERVSVLTEVKPVIRFDPNVEVDYSNLSILCDYFILEKVEFNEEINELGLSLRWKDQTQAIDPDTANPICILSGIKVTPKEDASWDSKDRLTLINIGTISYDIYLRANALYSFAQKPENQEQYDIYPFVNPDLPSETGGHFADTYKEFADEYTLSKGLKSGWAYEDGGYAYYVDGERYTGIQKIGEFYYDFGESGINVGQTKYTGLFQIEGVNYYAKDGVLASGWIIINEQKYCFGENGAGYDGKYVIDEVEIIFENGLMVGGQTGFVKKSDGKTYYYNNGEMTRGWIYVGEDLYHFNTETGTMTTGTHVIPDDEARAKGAYYDFADDGRTLRGYFNGYGYYYWAGLPRRDDWVKNGADPDPDAWYHTNGNGHFVTDGTGKETFKLELNGVTYTAVKIAYDGVVYTFNNANGKLLLGDIVVASNGARYYYWAGTPYTNGWFEFKGNTYYAFEDGRLASGSVEIDGEIYNFAGDCKLIVDGPQLKVGLSDDATQMTIELSGVDETVTGVRFAVWASAVAQGETLRWVDAVKGENGKWVVTIPMCQPGPNGMTGVTGVYNVHAYGVVNDATQLVANTTVEVKKATEHTYTDKLDPICDLCGYEREVNLSKATMVVSVSEDGKLLNVRLSGGDKLLSQVQFAMWLSGKQAETLAWWSATQGDDGVWSLTVPMCSYGAKGVYHIHAYAVVDGVNGMIDNTSITMADAIEHTYADKNDTTCDHCGYEREVEHEHVWAEEWSTNGIYHWHECVGEKCTATTIDMYDGYGEHSYSDKEDTTCNTCGYVRTVAVGSASMFRMYNPNSGEHFYTGSTEERDVLVGAGWIYEGIGFAVPVLSDTPVYRLCNSITYDHMYTADAVEMERLKTEGWNYEGIAFYSADNDEVPLYRLHNPNTDIGARHFTSSAEERDMLIAAGWIYEGIAWYCQGKPVHTHVWSSQWTSNETHHWRECTAAGCPIMNINENDGYSEHILATGKNTCSICGVKCGNAIEIETGISVDGTMLGVDLFNAANLTGVRFAVWVSGSQSETMIWVDAEMSSDGVWFAAIPLCQFGKTGKFNIHAYGTGSAGYGRVAETSRTVTEVAEHEYTDIADTTCNQCGFKRKVNINGVPMYRMYNPNTGEHFYTGSVEERETLIVVGWIYEGVGFVVPAYSSVAVYRLCNPVTYDHMYTADEAEKEALVAEGWNYEGIAFYSADEDGAAMYRLCNPNTNIGATHFTASIEERDMLIAAGWLYVGIGFYSVK